MFKIFGGLVSSSTVRKSINALPAKDRPKIVLVSILQVGLGFLDLLGIAAIGVLGALTVTGIASKEPGNRVQGVLEMIGISDFSFQNQVAFLGASAAILLIFRTIFSIIIIKRIFFFLSSRGAVLSSELVSKFLSQNLIQVQKKSTQETLFGLTHGVNAVTLGILGNAATLLSDGSLLIIITIGLLMVDPVIALSSVVLFGALGLALYWTMNVRAQQLGEKSAKLSIQSSQKILEVLESFRESVVRNRRNFYAKEIAKTRHDYSHTLAELQFMPSMSKYVIESGIVIGAVIISGIQFWLQDASHAVATLSVFLASGTRIAPAIMRLQQSAISIRAHAGNAQSTLDLLDSLKNLEPLDIADDSLFIKHDGFSGNVKVSDVSLCYPTKDNLALNKVSLDINFGESIAIVGPSGAGKTSLVDVLLGILVPDSGQVLLSNISPLDAINKWPGAIAYVPQDVTISNVTFRENISLGYKQDKSNDYLIWEALKISQLEEMVKDLPEGLDTIVGERGSNISGGQRQRLGIARAMFTKPKLLVLDEATSSLDGQTEADISNAIQNLKGNVTTVMIAHRLSTVRNADKVVYMESGSILAVGSFEEVRSKVPDFDRQAQLMGL